MDFQWSLKAPGKDNESKEGDVPRLQLQSPDQGSEPVGLIVRKTRSKPNAFYEVRETCKWLDITIV